MDPKIIYKLMVTNNPDEAIKQLVYFDKENKRLNNIIKTKDEGFKASIDELTDYANRIDKALEYIRDNPKLINDKLYKNDQDTSFVFINTKIKLDLLDILEGE